MNIGDVPMTFIKQYGLERSGTNAIRGLVEVNFDRCTVLSNTLGHKHLEANWETIQESLQKLERNDLQDLGLNLKNVDCAVRTKTLGFIFSIKDPVSWLWSYYRYARAKALRRDRHASYVLTEDLGSRFLNSWGKRMNSWLEFVNENEESTFTVQHEELLRSPLQVLDNLKGQLDLSWSGGTRELFLDGYAKRGIESERGAELIDSSKKFDRDYHLNGQWMEEMPKKAFLQAENYMDEFFRKNDKFAKYFDLTHLG
ncbi:hypothetical protein [Arthrobacter monumenti]